jgi:hypothetical protein
MATVDVCRITNELEDALPAVGLTVPYSLQIMVDKAIE